MSEESAVPDLYRLAFMPGCFRCPQCGFMLTKACLNPNLDVIGTREQDRESEPCPNDGTMMVHVTYREQLEVYAERLKEEFNEREQWRARAERLEEALREINQYSIKGVAPAEWSHGFKSGVVTMQTIARAALKEKKP